MEKYVITGGNPLVGEVEIGGAKNAALLAAQILAVEDAVLGAKLDAKRAADADAVRDKDAKLEG